MADTLKEICLRATRQALIKGILDGTPQSENQIAEYFFHYQAQRTEDWEVFIQLMKIMLTFMPNFTWYDGNKSIHIKNGVINFLKRKPYAILYSTEINGETLYVQIPNIMDGKGSSAWIWFDKIDQSTKLYGSAHEQAGVFNINIKTLQMEDWTTRNPSKKVKKRRRERRLNEALLYKFYGNLYGERPRPNLQHTLGFF